MKDNKEIKTAAGNIPSAEEQDKNRRKRKTARAALSFGIMVLLLVILFFAAVNIGSLGLITSMAAFPAFMMMGKDRGRFAIHYLLMSIPVAVTLTAIAVAL